MIMMIKIMIKMMPKMIMITVRTKRLDIASVIFCSHIGRNLQSVWFAADCLSTCITKVYHKGATFVFDANTCITAGGHSDQRCVEG